MAWFRTHEKQKPGKPIVARTLRQMAETCDWATRIQADPPLSIQSTAAGATLRLAGYLFGVFIGKTDGTITARSGSTPGSGNVKIQTWNGTALADLGIDVAVLNISSTTGGIVDAQYCIVLRIMGAYWIITLDCGN